MGWVDSHCHLDFDEFKDESIWTDLAEQGCESVLVPATQTRYFQRVLTLKSAHSSLVQVALGLHPFFITEHTEQDLDVLSTAIKDNQPAALGEFGLDYLLDEGSFDWQFYFFKQQLSLAIESKLPLVIHCRKAHDRMASEIKQSGFTYGGFIHGFSGSLQQAQRYLDLGFVLGLGGALTHERAKAMHKMVAMLPDDGFTLETDSPDMAPGFALHQVNTPLNIPRIAEHVARLKQQSYEQVIDLSTANYKRTLGL